MACLGCRLANGREAIHTVYEDDFVTCLLDHDPFSEGHTLIIPKRHAVELEELDAPWRKPSRKHPRSFPGPSSCYTARTASPSARMAAFSMSRPTSTCMSFPERQNAHFQNSGQPHA
ncbi:HIT family protein [Chromobacterium violaceum]